MPEIFIITIHLGSFFMIHPEPNCWSGDYHYCTKWSLWANPGVTVIHKTQLTVTLGQLTLCDWLPVGLQVRMQGCLCVYEMHVCLCECVRVCNPPPSPQRASMAGWCIRWHVNYSAFKRGLSWVEVSRGLMAVRWSGEAACREKV